MEHQTLAILISLPVVSGLIGYLTNRLALWMLFHPRSPKRLFGITFHGLVPSRQPQIARSVATTITGQLVTAEMIAQKLADERVQEAIIRGLCDYTRRYVADFLDSVPAPALLLLPRNAEDALNRKVERFARRHLPDVIAQVAPAMTASFNLAPVIEHQVAEYQPQTLEGIVKKIAGRELNAIEVWGGILGFLIGIAQALVFYFAG